jgi:CRISPR-associated protein Csd2
MTDNICSAIIQHKFTVVTVAEGSNCNLNGNVDNEAAPRTDPDDGHGRVSPQSASRRVKDFVHLEYGGRLGFDLQIQRGRTIEEGILKAAERANIAPEKKLSMDKRLAVKAQTTLLYFDTRMGGGVNNVGSCPAENVNGVVTTMWGRSVRPVTILEDTLTRVSATNEAQDKQTEMGRRYVVAHGVYTQVSVVNPHHAEQNGATMEDLAIYLRAMARMWEWKRSVMSGLVSMRGMWVFRHDSKYGSAPEHELIARVKVGSDHPDPRSWADYNLSFDGSNLPAGIKVFNLEDMALDVEALCHKLVE